MRAAAVAALLVLVAGPAVAHAGVSSREAIQIVRQQPAARTLLLTHPGARFTAQAAGSDWLVIVRQAFPRTPLASWLVDRKSGAVSGHSPTASIQPLRSRSPRRSRSARVPEGKESA